RRRPRRRGPAPRARGAPRRSPYTRPPVNCNHSPAGSRRRFLGATAAAGATVLLSPGALLSAQRRPRVAAVYTVFYHRSHAHVILEKFLRPYLFNGRRTDPGVDVVSFYADQR